MRKLPAISWSQHPKPKGPRGFQAWNISASPNIQKHLHIKSKWKDPLVIHAPNKLHCGPIGALLKSVVYKQKVLGGSRPPSKREVIIDDGRNSYKQAPDPPTSMCKDVVVQSLHEGVHRPFSPVSLEISQRHLQNNAID